ncbi:MAG: hypothetical protein E6H75_09475 [Betaproteobacteria bacterium]|nr:MAG: hypothetical protein E6H75_09475 [Betaproteobacteria bacterium]
MKYFDWKSLLVGAVMVLAAGTALGLKPTRAQHDTADFDFESSQFRLVTGSSIRASFRSFRRPMYRPI